jgi:hypothetical protein
VKLPRNRLILVALAMLVLLPSCQLVRVHWSTLTSVDAPLSFRPDRRLSMLEPDQEESVRLPVTVRWKSEDFDLSDGKQFGVFINTSIPAPGEVARVRLCTRLAELPPAPGDFRGVCTDQRDLIRFTKKHSVTIKCFEPHFNRGKRRMNDHSVTVVLLDKDKRRVGEAAAEVSPFRVNATDARKCRGFDS